MRINMVKFQIKSSLDKKIQKWRYSSWYPNNKKLDNADFYSQISVKITITENDWEMTIVSRYARVHNGRFLNSFILEQLKIINFKIFFNHCENSLKNCP